MRQRIAHGNVIDAVTTEELQEILKEFSRAGHYALGGDTIERDLRDWPVEGHDRRIAVARSHGGELIVPAAAYIDFLPQENGRGGLTIMNIGANPCNVFLARAKDAELQRGQGIAMGQLSKEGGSFDGEISKEVWVGPLSLFSTLGTTLIWGVI